MDVHPSNMPDGLEPMTVTLTQDRFVGANWSFERKFDGTRRVGRRDCDAARLAVRASPLEPLAQMKCELSQKSVVGGFTDPQGSRVGHQRVVGITGQSNAFTQKTFYPNRELNNDPTNWWAQMCWLWKVCFAPSVSSAWRESRLCLLSRFVLREPSCTIFAAETV